MSMMTGESGGQNEEVDFTLEMEQLLERSRGTRHEQAMMQLVKERVFEAEKQHYDDELAEHAMDYHHDMDHGASAALGDFDDTLLDAFAHSIHAGGNTSRSFYTGAVDGASLRQKVALSQAERQERRMDNLSRPTDHKAWKESPVARPQWAPTNHLGRQRPAPKTGDRQDAAGFNESRKGSSRHSQSVHTTGTYRSGIVKVGPNRFEDWIDSKYSWYRQSRERITARKLQEQEALRRSSTPRTNKSKRVERMVERVAAKVASSDAGLLESVKVVKEHRQRSWEKEQEQLNMHMLSPHKHLQSNIAFGAHTSQWEPGASTRSRSASPNKGRFRGSSSNNSEGGGRSPRSRSASPDKESKAAAASLDVFCRLYKYKDIYAEKLKAAGTPEPKAATPKRVCPGSVKILEKKGVMFREQGKFVVPEKSLEEYAIELGLEDELVPHRKSSKSFSAAPTYGTNKSADSVMELKAEPELDWHNPLNGSFEGSAGVARGRAFGPPRQPQTGSLRESIAKRQSQMAAASSSGSGSGSRSASPYRAPRQSQSRLTPGKATGVRAPDSVFQPLLLSDRKARNNTVTARGTFEERVNKEVEKYHVKRGMALKGALEGAGPGSYNTGHSDLGKVHKLSLPTARARSASPSRAGVGPHFDGSLRSASPGKEGYSFSMSGRGL